MYDLQALIDEIAKWSDNTFGNVVDRRLGMINHLIREIEELRMNVEIEITNMSIKDIWQKKTQYEIIDCLMLILDIASHSGLNANLKGYFFASESVVPETAVERITTIISSGFLSTSLTS